MWISKAFAQDMTVEPGSNMAIGVGEAPNAASAFAWNIGLVLVLVFMFYFLLIRPQQKRYERHNDMVKGLQKGDEVVTSGGLIGKIEKLKGDDEAVVNLGKDLKVTAVKSTLTLREAPAEEEKK